jgi:cysteine-rich repeat protein
LSTFAPTVSVDVNQVTWTRTPGAFSATLERIDAATLVAVDDATAFERIVPASGIGTLSAEVTPLAVGRWSICLADAITGEPFSCTATPLNVLSPSAESELNDTDVDANAAGARLIKADVAGGDRDRYFVIVPDGARLVVNTAPQSGSACAAPEGTTLRIRERNGSQTAFSSSKGLGASTCAQAGVDGGLTLPQGEYVVEVAPREAVTTSYNVVASVVGAQPGTCGNGVVDVGENAQCENTSLVPCPGGGGFAECDPSTCRPDTSTCPAPAICGNGVIEVGEECDVNGPIFRDFAAPLCENVPGFNADVGGVVRCDPNNCSLDLTSCTSGTVCGDGVAEGLEECDDGNAIDNDGCDHTCTLTRCGNGVVNAGEACDDGDLENGACGPTCQDAL